MPGSSRKSTNLNEEIDWKADRSSSYGGISLSPGSGSRSAASQSKDFSAYRKPARVMGLPARPQSGKLTRCYKTKPRQASLTEKKVFRTLGVCVCIAIFAISHLYLRFSIADANVEFRELQRQKAALETSVSSLEHDVTQLSDLGKLQDKAVDEFGLIQSDLPTRNLAIVPNDLVARYSEAPVAVPVRANQHDEITIGEDVQKLTMTERVFEKLLDGSWAVAQPER